MRHLQCVVLSIVVVSSVAVIGEAWAAEAAKLDVAKVFSSTSTRDNQQPEQAVDGKLEKGNLWGAPGDGVSITLDLGKPCTITAVRFAYPLRDDRPRDTAAFEILLSEDDVAYRQVFLGESDKTPLELESVEIPPSKARYVRYRGHGNSFNPWTSLAEIEAWGRSDGGASAAAAPAAEEAYEPPQLLAAEPPIEFAKGVKDLGWSGLVVYCATVDETGAVKSVRVNQGPTGSGAWRELVPGTVAKWKFAPARRGGKPVTAFYEGTVMMSQRPEDERAIVELWDRFASAWEKKDAAAIAALLTPGRRRLHAAGELADPSRTAAWLEKHFASATGVPLRDLRLEAVDFLPVGEAGGLIDRLASCELSFARSGPTQHDAERFHAMLSKTETGEWRILYASVPRRRPSPPPDETLPARGLASRLSSGRKSEASTLVQALVHDGQVVDTEVLVDNPNVSTEAFKQLHQMRFRLGDNPPRSLLFTTTVDEGVKGEGFRGTSRPAAGGVLRAGGGNIKEPKKLRHVNPVYPSAAREARISGVVIMEVTVDPKGEVANVRVLKGDPALSDAAVKAVSQWKYTPTLLNGQPVPVLMPVTVNFALD